MSEVEAVVEDTAVADESTMGFATFSKLPDGWQRVVIAALFVVALVVVVILRQLVQSHGETSLEESEAVGL